MTYLNYNGKILPANKPVIKSSNRAFRYGDGIFETIRMLAGKIPFIRDHIERLNLSMAFLQIEPPDFYTPIYFEKQIRALAEKNNLANARVRLSVFRNDGGYYSPTDNYGSFIIEMEELSDDRFSLNEKGLHVDIYPVYQKDMGRLSVLKSINAQLFVLAGMYKQHNKLDECLILNNEGRVCESISSNVIVLKNNTLYTPAFTEGPVAGIMKEIVFTIANHMDIDYQPAYLDVKFVEDAEEIWLTNAVKGVQWVGKFGNSYYKNDLAAEIVKRLNDWITR